MEEIKLGSKVDFKESWYLDFVRKMARNLLALNTKVSNEKAINNEFKYDINLYTLMSKGYALKITQSNNIDLYILFDDKSYEEIPKFFEDLRLNSELVSRENKEIVFDSETKKEAIAINRSSPFDDDVIKNKTYIVNPKDLTINSRKMEEFQRKKVIEKLLEYAKVTKGKKTYLDFYETCFDDGIQDYLIEELFKGEEDSFTKEEKEAISDFKGARYFIINTLLRNNFENDYVLKDIIQSVPKITDEVLLIDSAFHKSPKRDYDMMIYRFGNGNDDKSREVGSKNQYHGIISFGTNGGTFVGARTGTSSKVQYKKLLKKDEMAISPEPFISRSLLYHPTECEITVPSFNYTVKSKEEAENITNLEIESNGYINLTDNLISSLKNLRQILQSKAHIFNLDENLKDVGNEYSDLGSMMKSQGYNPIIDGKDQISLSEIVKKLVKTGEAKDLYEFNKKIKGDYLQYRSEIHGRSHTQRVAFNARVLANMGGLSQREKKILLTACQFHDIGRKNDIEDKEHGKTSAEELKEHDRNSKGYLLKDFSKDEKKLIYFMIEEHSKSKFENEEDLEKIPKDSVQEYKKMMDYLKDADKLDRVRLGKYDGLDSSRLSLDISRKLVKASYESFFEFNYIDQIIENYYDYQNNLENVNEAIDKAQNYREFTKDSYQDLQDSKSKNLVSLEDLSENYHEKTNKLMRLKVVKFFKEKLDQIKGKKDYIDLGEER